jgi:hypothetical protein
VLGEGIQDEDLHAVAAQAAELRATLESVQTSS